MIEVELVVGGDAAHLRGDNARLRSGLHGVEVHHNGLRRLSVSAEFLGQAIDLCLRNYGNQGLGRSIVQKYVTGRN